MQLHNPKTARFCLIVAIVAFFFIPMVWTADAKYKLPEQKKCVAACKSKEKQDAKPYNLEASKCASQCQTQMNRLENAFTNTQKCFTVCKNQLMGRMNALQKIRKACDDKCKKK